MFIVDLTELQRRGDGRLDAQRSIDANEFCDELDNISPIGQIKVLMVFKNEFGIISLKMNVDFNYDTVCDRCMIGVSKNMSFETSHTITSKRVQDGQEVDEDEDVTSVFHNLK